MRQGAVREVRLQPGCLEKLPESCYLINWFFPRPAFGCLTKNAHASEASHKSFSLENGLQCHVEPFQRES